MKFNGVSHVRPKASNASDVDQLPGGAYHQTMFLPT